MKAPLPAQIPFDSFPDACKAVFVHLQEQTGLSGWVVARAEGDDWIVLQSLGDDHRVEPGTTYPWKESISYRVVEHGGPQVVPDMFADRPFEGAGVLDCFPIGAFMGTPLYKRDGTLFGTLCGIDAKPRDESLWTFLPLLELYGRLLSTLLCVEQESAQLERLNKKIERQANTDALTGLLNRRGWERQLGIEEARARRYGSPCCVFIIDLNDLKGINDSRGHEEGDRLICRAATCLQSAVRAGDVIARIGGDEFAVLAVECSTENGAVVENNLRGALAREQISASIGRASRDPRLGIADAVVVADRRMYTEKRASRHRDVDYHI